MQTVYGEHGLELCQWYSYERPDLALSELLEWYVEEPCSQQTQFFRHATTLNTFALYTAPQVAQEHPVQITQIGSSGEEAWSIGALLETGDPVPYHIAGYNVNSASRRRAYGPFDITLPEMSLQSGGWLGEQALARFFEETADGVKPRDILTANVSFEHHDILESPVPAPELADAVAIFNVLWHYPPRTRNHIMAHTLAGLRQRGTFMFEGLTRDSRQASDYAVWTQELYKFGLFTGHRLCLNGLRVYDIETAEEFFAPSSEIEEALGVLAAARHPEV